MPRPKKSPPVETGTPLPPSKTSHLFQSSKPAERGNSLTHERIAEHLKAFQKAGGKIEVLRTNGATQTSDLPEVDPETGKLPARPAR